VNAPLYQFQATATAQIATGAPTYLGFDPGLGKSRTAIEAAKARGVKRMLVISPASGRYVWERECRLWWREMPFRIVNSIRDVGRLNGPGVTLVTYGLLSQKDSFYAKAIIRGDAFDMTVLDEAAAVKNPGANRTKVILGGMLPKLGYLLPMSGTPAPNHAGELYPILKAIYPSAITTTVGNRQMYQWEFEDLFCKVVKKRFGGGPEIRTIEGSKNLPELRNRMNGFMLRVRKEDVLKDLPPIRWDVVGVQPKLDVLAPLPSVPEGLSDNDLLKFLSGADGDVQIMRLRHLLGIAKTEASVDYIEDLINGLPRDEKVLVFAHHRQVVEALLKGLQKWSPTLLHGALRPSERAQNIDTFLTKPECRVLIANIAAAGTGLTLVGPNCKCSNVVFVEATYSVGDNVQAACRVHRIGQKDGVVARFLTAHGTIDDRIQSILARKAQDFEQLFDPTGE
jgi:SWI/SNF-related matrix-associated actin-dependent regulator 1 of chromatin subfamily A